MTWFLVWIVIINGASQSTVLSVHDTMHECFAQFDVVMEDVERNGVHAICIREEDVQ